MTDIKGLSGSKKLEKAQYCKPDISFTSIYVSWQSLKKAWPAFWAWSELKSVTKEGPKLKNREPFQL